MEASLDGFFNKQIVRPSYQNGSRFVNTGIIYAIGVNVPDRILYFSDRTSSILWEISLDSPIDGRIKLSNNVKAWDMSYDWINNYLYWTEDK